MGGLHDTRCSRWAGEGTPARGRGDYPGPAAKGQIMDILTVPDLNGH